MDTNDLESNYLFTITQLHLQMMKFLHVTTEERLRMLTITAEK